MIRKQLEEAVLEAIAQACTHPMKWGVDDCGLWIAGPIKKVFGYDIAEAYRGKYRSQGGAHKVLGNGGLAKAFKKLSRKHGWKGIDPEKAQAGDIGLVDVVYKGKRALGCVICRAPGWFVGRAELGVTAIPARMVRFCLKIAPHNRADYVYKPRLSVPMVKAPTRPVMVNTSAVANEPVSLTIGLTALIFDTAIAVGIPGVTMAVAGAIGGTLLSVGVAVGLNYAASALLQRGNQPLSTPTGGPNDPSIRYNTRQPIPAKRIIYGTAQVGGALFFEEIINPKLFQGILLCDKKIKGVQKIWLGQDELVFNSIQENTIISPVGITGQPAYNTHVQVSLRYGDRDQSIDPLISSNFPALSGTQISQATGTSIGNLTSGGGLAAAFDSNLAQTFAQGAIGGGGTVPAGQFSGSTAGFIGKNYTASPQSVSAGTVITPTDFFESGVALLRYKINMYGSMTNPANSTDGTLIGSTAYFFPPPAPVSARITVTSTDTVTSWNYVWFQFDIGVQNPFGAPANWGISVAEAQFFNPPATPSEFRQRGIATAVFQYLFGADVEEFQAVWGQTQRPNPILLVDGVSVPDPRNPAHILDFNPDNADEVAAAEATWAWSNNATLCQIHYLIQKFGGGWRPYKVDWDKIKQSADWDDTLLGTVEGDLIKRGTINGVITMNQRPADVISSMISANRAFVLESSGKSWVYSKPRAAVATIDDKVISGAIEYRAAKPKKDMINKLKVRFVAEDRDYQTVDGPVLERTDLIEHDQDVLEGVLDVPFTVDDRRAQFLQKAFLANSRLGKRISVTCDIQLLRRAADELVGAAVNFSSELFPQFNGLYFVEMWGFADNYSSIQLSLAEYDPDIETDWHPETDQQDFELAVEDVT